MVIVGSGNNFGSILGGFVIWFFWVESEPLGLWLMDVITSPLAETGRVTISSSGQCGPYAADDDGVVDAADAQIFPQGLIPETEATYILHFSGHANGTGSR